MSQENSERREESPKGLIFNIQRYSLHDGPGIRTTVFLKGCPLSCLWCSNPEGISRHPELMVSDHKCVACFQCLDVCTSGAIYRRNNTRIIDRNKCKLCFACVAICPYGALEMAGKLQTTREIVEEIEKDRLFYVNSHGGVTFSGGEPLFQAQFTREVFKICRQKAIHTTLDTAGCVPWAGMERVLEFTDLVLYDVKQLDPAIHKHWTGRTNKLILDNFTKTVKMVRTWVRVPIIPGFSDSAEFIKRLSLLISGLGNTKVEKISLLPYHSWGEQKYKKLGRDYKLPSMIKEPKIEIGELKKIVDSYGIEVSIGR